MRSIFTIFTLVFSLLIFTTSTSFANEGRPATAGEKKVVLKAVMTDVMLRGALAEAKKSGNCSGRVVSAINKAPAGIEFEVQIDCSAPADEYTGGGTFLMINVKGRVFGDSLENSVITVQKAG